MAKAPKKRADKYKDKVHYEGSFEDMIGMSVRDAEKRMQMRNEYQEFYKAADNEVFEKTQKPLIEHASVYQDAENNQNIKIEMLHGSDLDTIRKVKKVIEEAANKHGFTIDFVNLTGNIFDK